MYPIYLIYAHGAVYKLYIVQAASKEAFELGAG